MTTFASLTVAGLLMLPVFAEAAAAVPPAADPQAPSLAACACSDPLSSATPAGVVWRGPVRDLTLPAVVRLVAPVLWFSPDEPLLTSSARAPLPAPHPCDREPVSARGVVYYQVNRVVASGQPITSEDDPQFIDKVQSFALLFFFYYPEDLGAGPHRHDIESAEFYVAIDRSESGCAQVRIQRVKGHAHGIAWYDNILAVARDTRLPVTLLVEEGKHATCTDRNGDGQYTPGYDVNIHVNDAWGLRDIFGSGRMMSAGYNSAMSKARRPETRLVPPPSDAVTGTICVAERMRTPISTAPEVPRYELRSSRRVEACPASREGADRDATRLARMHRDNGFGPEATLRQYSSTVVSELAQAENRFRLVSGVALKIERDKLGLAVQGPGLDAGEVWLVPRFRWGRQDSISVDMLVTRSASRWGDWYVSAGYEWLEERKETDRGVEKIAFPSYSGVAFEMGYKFRFTFKGKARIGSLGYRFAGVRLGIRTDGFSGFQNTRAVVEIGAGVF